jgi:hypothetical protein
MINMSGPQWLAFQQWLTQQQMMGLIPQYLTSQQIYMYYQNYLSSMSIIPSPIPNPMSNPMPNPMPNPMSVPKPNPQTGMSSEIKELLPRNNKTDYYSMGNGQNIINVTLNASTGNKTVINASADTTIEELLIMYTKKIGLSPEVIGKQIMFLYNGAQLDGNSKDKIGSMFRNQAVITVYDLGGIIGA